LNDTRKDEGKVGATIKDIAKHTGLGLATISKYLNGGNVRAENKTKIEQAIKDLDYQVNTFARSLKSKKSAMVGIIIPQLNNLFMTSIVATIEEKLREQGYAVIVSDTGKDAEREVEVIDFMLSKGVDGLILLTSGYDGAGLDKAMEANLPIVLIDRKIQKLSGLVDMVLVDNFKAAYDSTRYLIANNHKKIALLVGSGGLYTATERMAGYVAALRDNKIELDDSLILQTDFSMQDGYQKVHALLENKGKAVTAIFATNAEMSLGAVLAIQDCGLKIKDDISVIGFDSNELSRALGIDVIAQPMQEIGERAAEMLLARMKNKNADPMGEIVTLFARRIAGDSVRKI
jgi:LacI family transcriptional regulator